MSRVDLRNLTDQRFKYQWCGSTDVECQDRTQFDAGKLIDKNQDAAKSGHYDGDYPIQPALRPVRYTRVEFLPNAEPLECLGCDANGESNQDIVNESSIVVAAKMTCWRTSGFRQ